MYVQNCLKFLKSLTFRPVLVFSVLAVFMAVGGSVVNLPAMDMANQATAAAKQVPDIEHPIKKPIIYSKTMRSQK